MSRWHALHNIKWITKVNNWTCRALHPGAWGLQWRGHWSTQDGIFYRARTMHKPGASTDYDKSRPESGTSNLKPTTYDTGEELWADRYSCWLLPVFIWQYHLDHRKQQGCKMHTNKYILLWKLYSVPKLMKWIQSPNIIDMPSYLHSSVRVAILAVENLMIPLIECDS